MKSILILLEAGDAYASGVVRGLVYKDLFVQYGYHARYISRLHPKLIWLASLIGQSDSTFSKVMIKLRLYEILLNVINMRSKVVGFIIKHISKYYDILYLSKVTDYNYVKYLKENVASKIVLDFGDAVWQYPDGLKFQSTLQMVDAVTTDCSYTGEYVKKYNPNCTVIPDCPQIELFDIRRTQIKAATNKHSITIGWIGSHSTVHNLNIIYEALEHVFTKHGNIHLRLVGTGHDLTVLPAFKNVRFSTVPSYNQSEMIDEVLKMDIGLFPLDNSEASIVRGILKATIYMSGEAVVVASPVGQSAEFIVDGRNGMLANSTKEWIEKLELLIEDELLRKAISCTALDYVRNNFTIEKSFQRLIAVFENLTGESRNS